MLKYDPLSRGSQSIADCFTLPLPFFGLAILFAVLATLCRMASGQALDAQAEWDTQFAAVAASESQQIRLQSPLTADQASRLQEISDELRDLLLDAGLGAGVRAADLTCLANLEHLRIRVSSLTDSDLETLSATGFPNLIVLNLPHSKVTARGIRVLRSFPKLRQLRLGGKQIDDSAVREMASLPKLQSIHLISPKLTQESLQALAKAPKLTNFSLDDCVLPADAWERLFRAKPKMHVHIDQRHHDRDPSSDKHD